MPTIGRYQLLDPLGQGGMAVVYRAYDTQLEREVALKLLAAHLITESAFYQRFQREARIIATLEHPSIVPVYDYGIDDNRQPYLVMRLLRGGTLRERRERGELSGADLWPAMRQVAAALDYAHGRNIVHRDIKPVNILFDEKGNAYVSDFGIAKVRDATTTELTGNALLGTPAYMSPEQFEAAPVDGRCDQYSLAIVLFEVLTGRLPFGGKTPNVLMNQHLNEPPVAAHGLNPALPPAVSAVLARALAKNPADRYPTAGAFVQELEASTYQRPAPVGAAVKADGEQQRLEGYYQAGLQAFQRNDWSAAVAFMGRVLSIDTAYRDASQVRQTALTRLKDQRDTPPPPPPPRPRPGPHPPPVHEDAVGTRETPRPKPATPRNARPWIVLAIALLVVAALALYVLWPTIWPAATPTPSDNAISETDSGTDEPAETPATPEEDDAPPVPPDGPVVAVVAAAQDSTFRCGQATTALSTADSLSPAACAPLRVIGGEGVTVLRLPDGTLLHLGDRADVTLTAEDDGVEVRLGLGRLLVEGEARVAVTNGDGATASLDRAGLLGVYSRPGSLLFEVACLAGQCGLSGRDDDAPVVLRAGQGGVVGNSRRAGPPENADFAPYVALAPDRVPTPTATPTRTPTATPTPSRTPAPYSTNPPAGTATAPGVGTPDATATKLYSDEDGDGILYHSDRCPNDFGPESNNGCPPAGPTDTPDAGPTEPPTEPAPTHDPTPDF